MDNQNFQKQVFDVKDIEDNKLVSALGYIGILCLLPLLLKKNSPYAQFHGKQGLVLFIAEIIVFFVNVIPFLGWLIWFVASIAILLMSIMGILKAWKGEAWELPILAGYAKKIKL